MRESCYIYRGNSVFFFTFPTIPSRKLILFTRKTRWTGKLIFFIRGGIIVEGINFYYTCVFPRYSVEIIVEKINICVLNTISVEIIVEKINICVLNTISVEISVEEINICVQIFKRFNMPNINIYLECISFLKLYTRESLQCAFS
jgi:hypothetical protein